MTKATFSLSKEMKELEISATRLNCLPPEEWGNCPFCFTTGVIGMPCRECCPEAWRSDGVQPYEQHRETPYIVIAFALIDPTRGPVRMCRNRLALIMRADGRPKDGCTTSYGHMTERWPLDDRSKPRGLTATELRDISPCSEKYFQRFLEEYDVIIHTYYE